jgi:hypothetical protein
MSARSFPLPTRMRYVRICFADCSWVNIGSLCKAAILAQVGHFYSDGVGQYSSGANI